MYAKSSEANLVRRFQGGCTGCILSPSSLAYASTRRPAVQQQRQPDLGHPRLSRHGSLLVPLYFARTLDLSIQTTAHSSNKIRSSLHTTSSDHANILPTTRRLHKGVISATSCYRILYGGYSGCLGCAWTKSIPIPYIGTRLPNLQVSGVSLSNFLVAYNVVG